MDKKGRAIDNIFIERLCRSVKCENVYLQAYESTFDLYNGLKEYFRFHKDERLTHCVIKFWFRDVLRSSSVFRMSIPSEMYNTLEVA
jgi:hypothetical protein